VEGMMSESQKQTRPIEIVEYQGKAGYIQPAEDGMFFIDLPLMRKAIKVREDEIKHTGKRTILEWYDPV
jgi:hypothetical protein